MGRPPHATSRAGLPALPGTADRQIRMGAFIFGALFAAVNTVWLLQVDAIHHIGVITKMSLVYTGVFAFLLLTAVNQALKRLAPRWSLSAAELLMVYAMMFMACSVAGLDFLQVFPTTLTHAFWYATPENHWEDLLLRDLPPHLTVSDAGVLADFYDGGSTLYTPEHIRPWIGPLAWWSALVTVLNPIFFKKGNFR